LKKIGPDDLFSTSACILIYVSIYGDALTACNGSKCGAACLNRPAAGSKVHTCCHAAEAINVYGVQVEGAFVMGMGLQTQEEVVYDPDTGALLSDGTWTYKIPTAACIPRRLNVTFLKVGVAHSSAMYRSRIHL